MAAVSRLLCLIVSLALLGGCRDRAKTKPADTAGAVIKPKYVFLIVIDTLRADHLGTYGYPRPTSPTLDRLAREGVTFERSFSTASSTPESIISIFTGTSAAEIPALSVAIKPLQALLKQGGFQTYSFTANPWLENSRLFRDNFDNRFAFTDWTANTTEEVTRRSIARINSLAPSGKPAFFYIHYLDPHDPYMSPRDYGFVQGSRLERRISLHAASGEEELRKAWAREKFRGPPAPVALSPNDLAYFVATYDTEIRFVDEHIARLVDALEQNRMLEQSLLIVTSDHGEGFLDHGLLKHGFQLYDELVRVPLIFYAPGKLAPARRLDLASGIDLAPTILGLCGLKAPDYMHGFNLFQGGSRDTAVPLRTYYVNQQQRGFRTLERKYIHDEITGSKLLYALDKDPRERTPITDPAELEAAEKLLRDITARYEAQPPGPRMTAEEMDPATRDRLRALGYVED